MELRVLLCSGGLLTALVLGPSLGVLVGAGPGRAQPETPGETATAEVEAEAGALSDGPGPQHLALADLAGEWAWTSVFRMDVESPGSEPDSGTARVEAVLGDRFIQIHERGGILGEAFEAVKTFGYNNAAAVYEGSWLYTGSTAMMRLRGSSEDGGRITVFQAQYATGPEEVQRFLVTLTIAGPDRFTLTLVALLEDGTAGPRIETEYTRTR